MKRSSITNDIGRLVAVTSLLLASACSGVDGAEEEGRDWDPAGTTEDALFDTGSMDSTAKLALPKAAKLTLQAADDPLIGEQVEYCGLIMRRTDGTFHASSPNHTLPFPETLHCTANVSVPVGSKVVGYYHTHTPASIPGISEPDKAEAKRLGRVYYVLSTATKCAQKFDPAAAGAVPKPFGCFSF